MKTSRALNICSRVVFHWLVVGDETSAQRIFPGHAETNKHRPHRANILSCLNDQMVEAPGDKGRNAHGRKNGDRFLLFAHLGATLDVIVRRLFSPGSRDVKNGFSKAQTRANPVCTAIMVNLIIDGCSFEVCDRSEIKCRIFVCENVYGVGLWVWRFSIVFSACDVHK